MSKLLNQMIRLREKLERCPKSDTGYGWWRHFAGKLTKLEKGYLNYECVEWEPDRDYDLARQLLIRTNSFHLMHTSEYGPQTDTTLKSSEELRSECINVIRAKNLKSIKCTL